MPFIRDFLAAASCGRVVFLCLVWLCRTTHTHTHEIPLQRGKGHDIRPICYGGNSLVGVDEGGVAMVVSMVVVLQEVPYVREEPAHVQEEGVVTVDRAAGPQSHVLAVGWTRS